MLDLDELIQFGQAPSSNRKAWLEDAESGVHYVERNASSADIILYACLDQAWVCSVLAPVEKLKQCELDDLQRDRMDAYSTCGLDYNDGEVFISFSTDYSEIFEDGEQLVFRRSFEGVEEITHTEISQQLIHSLGLYWKQDQNAFCRLNERGDVDPILFVIDLSEKTGHKGDIVVTIAREELENYMIATDNGLVMQFDFLRFQHGGQFHGWIGSGEMKYREPYLVYHTQAQNECSFANGSLIVFPIKTEEELCKQLSGVLSDQNKEYETFISKDRKTGKVLELSCDPKKLASYFATDSDLPYEITPAFFNPEVLQRYKNNQEKYDFQERYITCRGAWHLKSYDVNHETGQVHTYLIYLSNLPIYEQKYWRSFNETPKGDISARAMETDIKGTFSTQSNPLGELKSMISGLDKAKPDWWKPRGDSIKAVHYPVSPSPNEWAEAILALDQLVVEGFVQQCIRDRLDKCGKKYEKDWQSLRLLQEFLVSNGMDDTQAIGQIAPLKELHIMRSKVKGHSAHSERERIITEARNKHGSLAKHFRDLTGRCLSAFAELQRQLSDDTGTSKF